MRVAVNAFIFNECSELLMVRRSLSEDFLPGYWETPGGGMEAGEDPAAATQREVQEEVGLSVDVGRLFHWFMYRDERGQPVLNLHFLCTARPPVSPRGSADFAEIAWVAAPAVRRLLLTPEMRTAVENAFAMHAEWGRPEGVRG